jgi:RNA polymerase sigma-70 factor (ECF subfamily)
MTESLTSRDVAAFETVLARHRRELHVHCYRMLASFDEAEDAIQETMLRAWRHREVFADEAVRAWLYRVATNVCLDMIRSRRRRVAQMQSFAEVHGCSHIPTGCSTRSPLRTNNPTRS